MTTWEYGIDTLGSDLNDMKELLGQRGMHGWELVSLLPVKSTHPFIAVFRREADSALGAPDAGTRPAPAAPGGPKH
ncbi:MAG TPA: hypothetical protein VLV55_01265 [Rhizomicrobium sp.]|nr:hypothetical protein [Rhizomicrobium sp.]